MRCNYKVRDHLHLLKSRKRMEVDHRWTPLLLNKAVSAWLILWNTVVKQLLRCKGSGEGTTSAAIGSPWDVPFCIKKPVVCGAKKLLQIPTNYLLSVITSTRPVTNLLHLKSVFCQGFMELCWGISLRNKPAFCSRLWRREKVVRRKQLVRSWVKLKALDPWFNLGYGKVLREMREAR